MKKLFVLLSAGILSTSLFSCLNLSKSGEAAEEKKDIQNNGVAIDYTDTEKGDTTLLFVHGWAINKRYWNSQVAYFKPHYRVVTMDLPGFGKSGRNRTKWDTPTFGSDVNAVINQLHLKKVILIGHSMSGDIVVQAAINDPKHVIALVGVDNFKNVGIPNPDSVKAKQEYTKAMDMMRHHFKATAYQYINQELFSKSTDSTVRKRVLKDVARGDSTIAIEAMAQQNNVEGAGLVKANKPLYLINSDVHLTDTSGLHAAHISSHLAYIHGTGHYPMLEKPDEFNSLLAQAIKNMKHK